ncbi:MAG: hypothetical protein ACRDZ9_01105 [Acidimicrobiales bacterium]
MEVRDPAAAAELGRHLLDDLEVSEELDLRRWRSRPLPKRVRELAGELVRQSL